MPFVTQGYLTYLEGLMSGGGSPSVEPEPLPEPSDPGAPSTTATGGDPPSNFFHQLQQFLNNPSGFLAQSAVDPNMFDQFGHPMGSGTVDPETQPGGGLEFSDTPQAASPEAPPAPPYIQYGDTGTSPISTPPAPFTPENIDVAEPVSPPGSPTYGPMYGGTDQPPGGGGWNAPTNWANLGGLFNALGNIFTTDPTPNISPSGSPVGSSTPDAVASGIPLPGATFNLGASGGNLGSSNAQMALFHGIWGGKKPMDFNTWNAGAGTDQNWASQVGGTYQNYLNIWNAMRSGQFAGGSSPGDTTGESGSGVTGAGRPMASAK